MSTPTQIVYYPAPVKVYSTEEMRDIFSRFNVNDPVISALRQIFQTRFAQASLDAAALRMTEREAGHAGGRIQEITDFRAELLGYLEAREPDAAGNQPTAPRRKR